MENLSEKLLAIAQNILQSFSSIKNNRLASFFILLLVIGFMLLVFLILIFAF